MPFDRYNRIGIKRDKVTDNRRVKSALPLTIPPTSGDIYIISRLGDRLDNLAHEYYSDATLWPILAAANNLGKGTLAIEPGKQIRIPAGIEELKREWRINNSNRR